MPTRDVGGIGVCGPVEATFSSGSWQAAPAMRIFPFLAVVALTFAADVAVAQTPPAPAERIVVSDTVEPIDTGIDDDLDTCPAGKCCPPSTSKKLIMGVASIAAFLILFFLMVRLMERVFIKQERSPLLGRHLGISLALFLGGGAVCGILFAGTGCWALAYSYWAGFLGVVWVLQLAYTLIAIRKS